MNLDAEDKEYIALVVDRAALAVAAKLEEAFSKRFDALESKVGALDDKADWLAERVVSVEAKVDLLLSVHPQLKPEGRKLGLTWGRNRA